MVIPSASDLSLATMVAPIGEPYGPVESEFGFHIIVVASRTIASAEEIRQALTDQAVFSAASDWFNTAVTTADVEVDEEYGTWTTDPVPQVVPA
jgi:parvulin-like peptidyl-prolyl isomerase